MAFPKFNRLSPWEQIGVISGILGIISLGLYFADKFSANPSNDAQKPEPNTSITINGTVNNSPIAGHDVIHGMTPESVSQIVTTLINKSQLDLQVKDEQIKSLTEAVTALSKGQGIDASPAELNTALAALAQGNTALAKSLFANAAEKAEKQAKQGAEAYRNLGALAFLDNTQEALQAYRRATQLDPGNADGWNQLGGLFFRVGDLNEAIAAYNTVLALGEQHDDKDEIAVGYGNLGNVYLTHGDVDKALEVYQKALRLDEALGDKEGMARNYGNLGNVYLQRGDMDKAIEFYRKALVLNESLGRKEGMANIYGNLGNVYLQRGDMDKAIEFYQNALKLDEELGSKVGIAIIYGNLGIVYGMRGDLGLAIEFYQKALKLHEALGSKEGMASIYANLGKIYQLKGNKTEAKRYYLMSIKLFKQIGSPNEKTVQTWLDALQ